jgi:hypothetical protein
MEVRLVPGLDREQIVETLKPTIRLKGEIVQVGEVVLGRPAPEGWKPPVEGPEDSVPEAAGPEFPDGEGEA